MTELATLRLSRRSDIRQ